LPPGIIANILNVAAQAPASLGHDNIPDVRFLARCATINRHFDDAVKFTVLWRRVRANTATLYRVWSIFSSQHRSSHPLLSPPSPPLSLHSTPTICLDKLVSVPGSPAGDIIIKLTKRCEQSKSIKLIPGKPNHILADPVLLQREVLFLSKLKYFPINTIIKQLGSLQREQLTIELPDLAQFWNKAFIQDIALQISKSWPNLSSFNLATWETYENRPDALGLQSNKPTNCSLKCLAKLSKLSKLTSITLDVPRACHTLPPEWKNLAATLQHLSLSSGRCDLPLPKEWSSLSSLSSLVISNTRMTRVNTDLLRGLSSLQRLVLKEHADVLPLLTEASRLTSLTQLKILDIDSPVPNETFSIPNLRQLVLAHKCHRDSMAIVLSPLGEHCFRKLEVLVLQGFDCMEDEVSDMLDDWFPRLTALTHLHFHTMYFDTLPPNVTCLTNLQKLTLSKWLDMDSDTFGWSHLRQLPNLRAVELDVRSSMRYDLYRLGTTLLSRLTSLRLSSWLGLSWEVIWENCKNLESLDFGGSICSSLCPRLAQCIYSNMPKLKYLNLAMHEEHVRRDHRNQVWENAELGCLMELARKRPDLVVDFTPTKGSWEKDEDLY